MEFLFSLPILVSILLGLLIYWYFSKCHRYWEKLGIPYVPPLPLINGLFKTYTESDLEIEFEKCKTYGRIFGSYEVFRPILNVAEPELIRKILVKDFHYFTGRREFGINDEILENMLVIKKGEDWKRLRSIVSPTFSTGKIKKMLSIFIDSAKGVAGKLSQAAEEGKEIDVKKIFEAFTLDVIASTAFSTKINSHNDPNNIFASTARSLLCRNITWRKILFLICPSLVRFFKIDVLQPNAINFFKETALQIIKERRKTGQTRNDFLQLLLDTAKDLPPEDTNEEDDVITRNYETDDKFEEMFKIQYAKSLTLDEIVAQCVLFFFAGFGGPSSTISISAHFLARYPNIQEKVFQDIKNVLQEHDGELTYEALKEMKYLDNFISEVLRYLPPAIRLERKADADYVLGETGITVPKGMIVIIPLLSIQHDPEFFPNPETFNPERFSNDAENEIKPYTYLPFGDGPRMCIANRFALLELKCLLAYLIPRFIFKMGPRSKPTIDFYVHDGLMPKEVVLQIDHRKEN